ncbi:MAG: M20/M25/M40 family metallo-hydrolase, partial [Alphaproteobacteria bacterium]|nr:M20/M25/M40 family metallo-hydrolase [Alphaproteobacteria bacterium]
KTLSKEADEAGFVNVTLNVIGKQGHSAFKDLTNNAIPHLSDLVSRLKKESDAEFVGLQSGFIAENIAPGEAEACLKIKIADGQTADETLANLRKELTKDSKEREIKVSLEQKGEQKDTPNSENGRIKYNFRFNTNYESGSLFTEVESRIEKVAKGFESSVSAELDPFVIEPCKSKEGKFTKVFTDAIEATTGIKPEKSFGGGATDTRYLVAEGVCKTAALDFGLVCKTMHSPDECIKAGEIRDLTNIFDRAMGSFFKIKERENTLTIEQRQEQARKTIIEARNKKLAPAVIKKALEQHTK